MKLWSIDVFVSQVSAYQSGVSLVVDKSDVTIISLLLQSVSLNHSGEYECRPDNAPPASIRLHVIKGMNLSISDGTLSILAMLHSQAAGIGVI